MAELLLYTPFYNFTAETVVREIGKSKSKERLLVRLNSPGGNTSAGFSILSRMSELEKRPDAIVDGNAMSMAAFMLPFFNKVTANDTSRIMFHKAAFPTWYEPSAAEKANSKRQNQLFEEKVRARVQGKPGAESFLAKLFEADVRNDVELTPFEAKELGLVDEVRTLEPNALYSSGNDTIALIEEEEKPEPQANSNNNNNKKPNSNTMEITPEELAQKVATAREEGAKAENKRARGFVAYVKIDADAAIAGVKDMSAEVDAEVMAEMQIKMQAQAQLKGHEKDNADETKAPKPGAEVTAEQKVIDADNAAIDAEFGEKLED